MQQRQKSAIQWPYYKSEIENKLVGGHHQARSDLVLEL